MIMTTTKIFATKHSLDPLTQETYVLMREVLMIARE